MKRKEREKKNSIDTTHTQMKQSIFFSFYVEWKVELLELQLRQIILFKLK